MSFYRVSWCAGVKLYDWAEYGAAGIPYLRTSGASSDQAEVVLEPIPESVPLTVNRGEVFIVQYKLEIRRVLMWTVGQASTLYMQCFGAAHQEARLHEVQ